MMVMAAQILRCLLHRYWYTMMLLWSLIPTIRSRTRMIRRSPAIPTMSFPMFPAMMAIRSTPLDISPYFVDVDGEALTFGFDPLDPDVPAWLSIDPVTGVITGTPPCDASQGGPNSDGIYPITSPQPILMEKS